MNRLLVASDLSDRSDRAVVRAVRLAAVLDAPLTVVHVVDEAMPQSMAATVETEARAALARTVEAQPPASGIAFEIVTVVGDPVEAIDAAAVESGADLLIFGGHRQRRFADNLRETTLERLVRMTDRPALLAIGAAEADYASVLGAVDMSPACARAISAARTLAPSAAMTLFHAYQIPFQGLSGDMVTEERALPYREQAERVVQDWIAGASLPPDTPRPDLIEEAPGTALQQMLTLADPDLLAIGAHSRSAAHRWLIGGFAASLVRNPPCDLLIAR